MPEFFSRHRFVAAVRNLSLTTRCLLGVWALFFLLVGIGVHGSSINATVQRWTPERWQTGYLFESLPWRLQKLVWDHPYNLREWAMANPQLIRTDEYLVDTPYALSQLSHQPRFPVINTNIGMGQNMLLMDHAPVWHPTIVARPITWGYFLFGAQRGLAWSWWFQPFACFTVLWLLLEIILQGHRWLAAFGAFWFCASAYTVCWSLWPTYIVFFPTLGCLAAYRLLISTRPVIQVMCGLLIGLSIPGLLMFVYPPWQVTLGYLFLVLFAGLFIRDRLYLRVKKISREQGIALTLALLLAGSLSASFLVTCWPAIQTMTGTIYPGSRFSVGGDYSFVLLFKGIYNLLTIYETPPYLMNQSEAASFYYFSPAVLVAGCLSPWWAKRLGIFGWFLIFYLVACLIFALVGIPPWLAKLTKLSYVTGRRTDIGMGLASIVLCLYAHARAKEAESVTEFRWRRAVPWVAAGVVFVFYFIYGVCWRSINNGFPIAAMVIFAALLAAVISYAMLAGKSRIFCGLLGITLVATTAFFNPLSTRLDFLYETELAQQVTKLNRASAERPLWLCYGGGYPGTLLNILGAHTISGIHLYPQLALWHALDPDKKYEWAYNRYAHVSLFYKGEEAPSFDIPQGDVLSVYVSPHNPALKAMGARYVLAFHDMQPALDKAGLHLIYKGKSGTFSIYEYPSEHPSEHPADDHQQVSVTKRPPDEVGNNGTVQPHAAHLSGLSRFIQ